MVWQICIKSTTYFNNLIRPVCANKHIVKFKNKYETLKEVRDSKWNTAEGKHECHQQKERMARKKVNDIKILSLMKERKQIMNKKLRRIYEI